MPEPRESQPSPVEPPRPVVDFVGPADPAFDDVYALYRRHSRTLGQLPRGAFREFAEEGTLLAARLTEVVVGYVAYRLSRDYAVIVHLCVSEAHRRSGVARALLAEVFQNTSHLASVRLSCRRDYEANLAWPRFGFQCVRERSGRGRDQMPLLDWRRSTRDEIPLLTQIDDEQRRARRTAAVDANVFFDFDSDTERALESRSLLADWLEPEIAIGVTAELRNEIARNDDETVVGDHAR